MRIFSLMHSKVAMSKLGTFLLFGGLSIIIELSRYNFRRFSRLFRRRVFYGWAGRGHSASCRGFFDPRWEKLLSRELEMLKTKDNTMPSGGVSQQCLCIIIIMFPATFVLIVESKKNTREISGRLHRHHMHHRPSNLFLSFCNFCELLLSYLFYQHLCQYPCLFL